MGPTANLKQMSITAMTTDRAIRMLAIGGVQATAARPRLQIVLLGDRYSLLIPSLSQYQHRRRRHRNPFRNHRERTI